MVPLPKKKKVILDDNGQDINKETDNISVVTSKSKISKTYDFLEHLESIKKRPDTYVGSVVENEMTTRIVIPMKFNQIDDSTVDIIDKDKPILVDSKVKIVTGLIQIYAEILSNAIDNSFVGEVEKPTTKIWIDIDPHTGVTSIKNNGSGIPIIKHERANMYIPEMIFCKLISGSHFDDNLKRKSSGRNGYGAKLTNAFSDEFIVETVDIERKLKFYQKHYDGMTGRDEPIIKPLKKKEEYTKITWKPTFSRFGISGYNNAHLQKMHMMAYQSAMITGVDVIFNGQEIFIPSLQDYTKLIYPSQNSMTFESEDSETVLIEKNPEDDDEFEHCCYVNGIQTQDGGVHLDKWSEAIFKPLLDVVNNKLSKGDAGIKLTTKDLKSRFILFLKCTLINPSFDSQTKTRLNAPMPTTESPTTKQLKEILGWPVIDYMTVKLDQKTRILISGAGSKRGKFKCIPKLTDATAIAGAVVGKKASVNCSLFLTEGDSAKTFVIKGMNAIDGGSEHNGAMPLKGKILNARKHSAEKMLKNAEIQNIINAIGLKTDVDYTNDDNFLTLRYQNKIIIAADQDVDGFHIASLLVNFFHHYFPTLLKRDFIYLLWTPIIIIPQKKTPLYFYQVEDAEKWMNEQKKLGKRFQKPIYKKGLGGYNKPEIVRYFENPRYIRIDSPNDAETMKYMNLAFSNATVDQRREWMNKYFENHISYDTSTDSISIKDLINHFLIQYAIHVSTRAIPSFDGLKDSHRKILTGALKSGSGNMVMVPQISADAAKITHYHHGTEMLADTLVGMGASYAGSNNIPYFKTDGNFGTRLSRTDAAAPRYLSATLNPIIKYIFRREDDCILKPIISDNVECEPETYYPIIPPVLFNGAEGIGEAYAVNIPMYNPIDLVKWIRIWINNKYSDENVYSERLNLPTLIPWYRGFKGTIEIKDNKIISKGVIETSAKGLVHVTEIPIGVYLDDYETTLKTLAGFEVEKTKKKTVVKRKRKDDETKGRRTVKKLIKGMPLRMGDDEDYTFIVTPLNEQLTLKNLKLIKNITPNFTVSSSNGQVTIFKNVYEYLEKFCNFRLDAYEKRKNTLLIEYNQDLSKFNDKYRYILEYKEINREVAEKDDEEIDEIMSRRGYAKINDSYKHLNIDVYSGGKKLLNKLLKQIQEYKDKISYLEENSAGGIWYDELNELEDVLENRPWFDAGEEMPRKKKVSKKSKKTKNIKKDMDDENLDKD